MIICNKLCKSYDNTPVLRDFSYTFADSGFYLLFGPSGCGKTTLLNMLCGVIPFDGGTVSINGQTFHGEPHWEQVCAAVGYVTQQVHFVDYLTVRENLLLASADAEKIEVLLKQYGLSDRQEEFPAVLSGGERQRLSIIQAVLADKRIILLDEPTASLDPENKRLVFDMLRELSREKCIICSSHDRVAQEYAEHTLDFAHISDLPVPAAPAERSPAAPAPGQQPQKLPLARFTKKWFSYKGRAKGSGVILSVIFVLSILAVLLGDIYTHKYTVNIREVYHLNQLVLCEKDRSRAVYDRLKATEHVLDVSLLYNMNVPMDDESINCVAFVLPADPRAFALADRVQYGHYLENENQIMLPYSVAEGVGNSSPADAVGKQLTLNLYGGDHTFEVAGVFSPFSEVEKEYLQASLQRMPETISDGHVYLSSAFTARYADDRGFANSGTERLYTVYFDSFDSMSAYAEQLRNAPDYDGELSSNFGISMGKQDLFLYLFVVLFPLALLMTVFALLFYLQNQRVEAGFMRHVFAIYQYHGYTYTDIRRCWLKDNVKQVIKLLLLSFVLASAVALVFNVVNEHIWLVPFRVFTFNPLLLAALAVLTLITTVLAALFDLHKLKINGWNAILMEERDLL